MLYLSANIASINNTCDCWKLVDNAPVCDINLSPGGVNDLPLYGTLNIVDRDSPSRSVIGSPDADRMSPEH